MSLTNPVLAQNPQKNMTFNGKPSVSKLKKFFRFSKEEKLLTSNYLEKQELSPVEIADAMKLESLNKLSERVKLNTGLQLTEYTKKVNDILAKYQAQGIYKN